MNDLYQIPYEPKRMLVDCMDMPPEVELAHRRLCDFIWAMDVAPEDSPETLQGITRCQVTNWARVRGGLERKGWHVEAGMLVHSGVMATLTVARNRYNQRVAQARAAANARYGRAGAVPEQCVSSAPAVRPQKQKHTKRSKSQKPTEPQQVSKTGTARSVVAETLIKMIDSATDAEREQCVRNAGAVLEQCGCNANNNHNHSTKDSPPIGQAKNTEVELPVAFPKTEEEATSHTDFVGCPNEFTVLVWNKAMSRNGRDAKGQPIMRWRNYLRAEWTYEQNRAAEKKQPAQQQPSYTDKSIAQKEFERICAKMTSIRNTYSDNQTWREDDRKLWAKLKARKADLKKYLGVMI